MQYEHLKELADGYIKEVKEKSEFIFDFNKLDPIVLNRVLNSMYELLFCSYYNKFYNQKEKYWNEENPKESPVLVNNDKKFIREFYEDLLFLFEYDSFNSKKYLKYIKYVKDNNEVGCDLYKGDTPIQTLNYQIKALAYLYTELHTYEDPALDFIEDFQRDSDLRNEITEYALANKRYCLLYILRRLKLDFNNNE